jgi:K+-sensing histidine kinase KdpD
LERRLRRDAARGARAHPARDRDALQRNIALAEELGTTDRAGEGRQAVRRPDCVREARGITHVVFGQTAHSRWEIVFKRSTLNRFLEEVRDAAVQVVPLVEP